MIIVYIPKRDGNPYLSSPNQFPVIPIVLYLLVQRKLNRSSSCSDKYSPPAGQLVIVQFPLDPKSIVRAEIRNFGFVKFIMKSEHASPTVASNITDNEINP